MKKLALVGLVLLLALPLSAGILENATVTLSGDASLTWGIDLMSAATGFTNALNAKLQIDFKPHDATITSSGSDEGAIYGEIKFDEISVKTKQINNADDNDADLEMDIDLEYAKIMGNNWWISIKGSDSAIDYENAMQNGIIGIAAAWDGQMDMVSNTVASSGGFEVGLTLPDLLAVEVSGFSLTDWTVAWNDDANAYGFKASVALKAVPNLTAEAAINMGFLTDAGSTRNDALGVGAKAGYTIALGDTMSLAPEFAVDLKALDGGGMDVAIGNGVKFGLGGSEVSKAEDGVQDDTGTSWAWDDGVNSGLTLGWDVYLPGTAGMDTAVGLQAHLGIGMIENVQAAVGFEISDVLSDAKDMGFAVYGRYDAGVVIPSAGLFMRLDNEANGGSDAAMVAEVNLAVPDFIPHTSFYLDWNSGNLSADDTGDVADGGIVKATVKIVF
jgi:hypothetical protein